MQCCQESTVQPFRHSPLQRVFGIEHRLPADLTSYDVYAPDTVYDLASTDASFEDSRQIREAAMKAHAEVSIRDRIQDSVLARPCFQTVLRTDDVIMVWKTNPPSKRGRWVGPGVCIGTHRGSVWVTFSNALRHCPSGLVQNRNAQLVQRTPTHHVAENDFGTIRRLNLKKIHTKCFVEAKDPRQRCWKRGFWRMPFGCTCWTLELSSHVVVNLWSGTTETKSPQEFLLARVPTIVMDILNYLPLARCQRFPDNCFTVATVLIVRGISSVTISSAPLPSGSSSCCSVSIGKEQAMFKSFRSDRHCAARRFCGV